LQEAKGQKKVMWMADEMKVELGRSLQGSQQAIPEN